MIVPAARGVAVWRPVIIQSAKPSVRLYPAEAMQSELRKYGNCSTQKREKSVSVRKRRGQENEQKVG